MRKLLDFGYKAILAILLDALIVVLAADIYLVYFSEIARDKKVQEIYESLLAQTGQTQDALPLEIVDEPINNAYNDGSKVVIYTGLINNTHSWDEVALVLGHEIAHGMLWHLKMPLNDLTEGQVATLEGNADKMGAVYMMKAGYDVCKGRELFKYWKEKNGNALDQNHPDNSYRYDELNINCD